MKKEVELFNYITGESWKDEDYWWIHNALIDEEFVENYKPNWYEILEEFKDEEQFYPLIKLYKDLFNWDWISRNQKLSEDFIREFKDEVKWIEISASQSLSEAFIREFKDKVDWKCISLYQTLSPEFREEFKDRL